MPAGVQVFDESGKIDIDISNRLTQVIGTRKLDEINGEIHINIDGNRKAFFFVSKCYFQYPPAEMISCQNSVIKWDFSKYPDLKNQYEIVYGVV